MTSDHIQRKIVFLLTDAHEAARAGDWTAVRNKTEEVLRLNPFNHDARAYWTLARNGGVDPNDTVEKRIADHLEFARIALESEDWATLGEECRLVLELDPTNAVAEGYLREAEETIARLAKRGGLKAERAIAAAQSSPRARLSEAPGVPVSEGTFADNDGLTVAASAVVTLVAVLYLAAGAFYLWGASIVQGVAQGSTPASEALSFDEKATIVAFALAAGFVAGAVLFFFWMLREIASTRAAGQKTHFGPFISLAVSLAFGILGTYIVLRDLTARLRGGAGFAGEAMVLAWLVCGGAGLILSGMVVKQPVDHAEWADLLRLTALASFLLGAAGLLLALTLRQAHGQLQERYVAPSALRTGRTEVADAA